MCVFALNCNDMPLNTCTAYSSLYVYILDRQTETHLACGDTMTQCTRTRKQARIQDFLQGGGVNDGRVQRAPLG